MPKWASSRVNRSNTLLWSAGAIPGPSSVTVTTATLSCSSPGWAEGVMATRKLIALAALSSVAGIGAVAGLADTANAAAPSGVITTPTISYANPVHHHDAGSPVRCGEHRGDELLDNGRSLNGSHTWLRIQHDDNVAYVQRASINPPAGLEHCSRRRRRRVQQPAGARRRSIVSSAFDSVDGCGG